MIQQAHHKKVRRRALGPAGIVVLLTTMLCPGLAGAQDPVMVTILVPEYSPYSRIDGTGLWIDLVRAALVDSQFRVDFRVMPLERMRSMAREGSVPAFINSTLVLQAADLSWIRMPDEPFHIVDVGLFAKPMAPPPPTSIESVLQQSGRVGALRGTGSVRFLAQHSIVADLSDSTGILVRKLIEGRIDSMVLAELTGFEAIGLDSTPIRVPYRFTKLYESPIGFMTSILHPEGARLSQAFIQGMARIRANGTYQEILQRYKE